MRGLQLRASDTMTVINNVLSMLSSYQCRIAAVRDLLNMMAHGVYQSIDVGIQA